MTIPIQAALIAIEDLRSTETELMTLKSDLENAQNAANGLSASLKDMEAAKQLADERMAAALQELATERTTTASLTSRVTELETRPPAPLLTSRKPTITKTEMLNVAGVAVPKGNAPSAAQDQNSRDLILLASMMGFNAWRGFFNLSEVKAHTAMADTNINHLPGYGRRLEMTVVFDTLNNPAVNLSDADLKIYLDGLRKMAGSGPFVGYFDDANQYREARNTDGTLKYPVGTLERLVGRIRQFAPDIILIASLTAGANISNYKSKDLFDFVEAQTFGKIGELPGMLDNGFDVYCMDGRREISMDYLTQAVEIIAKSNPRNVFYYVTAINDWKNMGEKIPLIKQTVARWLSNR